MITVSYGEGLKGDPQKENQPSPFPLSRLPVVFAYQRFMSRLGNVKFT